MARRLPVYLLLDTSGSMDGEPIEQVKTGVDMLVSSLRSDPYALETAHLSVITFDTNANVAVPLTELTDFQVPDLRASGLTSLGEALSLVCQQAKNEGVRGDGDSKGDWRPMVFIMTDGLPTDDFEKGVQEFKNNKWGIVVGCAVNDADVDVLKKVSAGGGECVVKLNTADESAMKAFFKWVTASVSTSSKSVETTGKQEITIDELPPPPPEIQLVD